MAKQPTRFRVTEEMIDAAIKGKPTYTKLPSGKTIVCELTLANGFTVTGKASVIDLRNHVEKIGRESALSDARNNVRQFIGYDLQKELHEDQSAKPARAKKVSTATKTIAGNPVGTRTKRTPAATPAATGEVKAKRVVRRSKPVALPTDTEL